MLTLIWDTICKLSRDANLFGVNVPLIKDPKLGTGSVSLTLVFISSILVIVGLVGKWSGLQIDIENALEFFYASSALYFGRKWTNKSSASLDVSTSAQPADPKDPPKE